MLDLSSLLNKTKAEAAKGIPVTIHETETNRHDYVAIAIREALEKAFPGHAKEALDRIAVVWATVALKERAGLPFYREASATAAHLGARGPTKQ